MQISQGMEHCDWLINNRIYKEAIVLPNFKTRKTGDKSVYYKNGE